MNIENILSKALGIAKDKKFNVYIYDNQGFVAETKELTYLQFGSYLIINAEGINKIHIFLK